VFIWRFGLIVRIQGVVAQLDDILAIAPTFSDSVFSDALTPRGVPFTVLTDMSAIRRLIRVADLHAFDVNTPLSPASSRVIENRLSARLQEMAASGQYSLQPTLLRSSVLPR